MYQKIRRTLIATIALGLLNVGCSPMAAVDSETALDLTNSGVNYAAAKAPACTVDYSEFELSTQVLAFEIVDTKGFNFGFNFLNGFFEALGLTIQSERGQMTMSLGLNSTVQPNLPLAHVLGQGQSKKNEFKFTLNALKLGTEFGYFKQTPLSQLAERTLSDSLSRMKSELQSRSSGWKSKVVFSQQDEFVIPVGFASGVRQGDVFNIYNIDYVWEGQPCSSSLLLDKKTTDTPIVRAVAKQVEDHATLIVLSERLHPDQVMVGARVEAHQLVQGRSANALARPVKISRVESGELQLPQGLKYDFKLFVREQLKALLPHHGFQLRTE